MRWRPRRHRSGRLAATWDQQHTIGGHDAVFQVDPVGGEACAHPEFDAVGLLSQHELGPHARHVGHHPSTVADQHLGAAGRHAQQGRPGLQDGGEVGHRVAGAGQ